MKILIIDECYYTRCGVHAYLNNNPAVKLIETATIDQASFSIQDFDPDIVIVNLTQYCSYGAAVLCQKNLYIVVATRKCIFILIPFTHLVIRRFH